MEAAGEGVYLTGIDGGSRRMEVNEERGRVTAVLADPGERLMMRRRAGRLINSFGQ